MRLRSISHTRVLPALILFAAVGLAAFAQAVPADLFKSLNYRNIGPTRESGRFVDIAVPVQQKHTFYAAAATGGLWKTTNNGQTFTPLFTDENVFSIGDVAVAPSDPNLVWLGSGEANNSRTTYYGDGVYKSTDGGRTWKNMGLAESHHIGRIIIHPADPDVVYVAALGHLYSENPDRGLYKTADGGLTWTKVLGVVEGGRAIGCVDVVMDPSNPDVLYAATYDRLRKFWTYDIGGPGSGVHKTTDGGKTWTKLAGGLPGGLLGRIGLAIYPRNSDILYAEIENVNKPGMDADKRWKEIQKGKTSSGMINGEIYRSDDAGATWVKVSPDKQNIGGNPGYYYGQIIVDPADDKHVYVLSVGVLESRDGGKTWKAPFVFGGDNHALWIDPADSAHMILGFDHGLGVTWDGGKSWAHPDNLPIGQMVAVDFDNSRPYNVAGGLQDNGSVMGPSTKKGGGSIRLEDWTVTGGGDGMMNVFDRRTNRYLYNESQFGVIQRLDPATGEAKSIAYDKKSGLRFNWNSPIIVSAHNPGVVYHAGNLVLKSVNRGETWTEISPDLTTNDPAKLPNKTGGDGNIQACTVTFMAESRLQAGLLWAGTDDGLVWMTKDDGKNWTKVSDNIAGRPAGYWVSRVEASPSDPARAYAAYSGFRNDDFRPFIYKTTDSGATWTAISNGLPNETVNVVREDPRNPNLLFAGTDGAVYASWDGGGHWTKMKGNMPTQPVHDLQIHPRDRDLIVATHGRSIWIADISALEEISSEVLAEDVHLFSCEPGYQWPSGPPKQTFSANYSGKSEPVGIAVQYYLKKKSDGDVLIQIFQGAVKINELPGTAEPGLNSVIWNMAKSRPGGLPPAGARPAPVNIEDIPEEYRERFMRMRSGPPVGEGEYRIVLLVDGKSYATTAEVRPDPAGCR